MSDTIPPDVPSRRPEPTPATAPFFHRWSDLPEELPPPRIREFIAVLGLVVLADLTVYRTEGLAGLSILFAVAPMLMVLASPIRRTTSNSWMIDGMLLLLAARLVWCGTALGVVCGCGLLVAFAMTLAGRSPFVLATLIYAAQTLASGARGLMRYEQSAHSGLRPLKGSTAMSLLLPLTAFAVFGSLFVLANPDLVTWVSQGMEAWLNGVKHWLVHFSFFEIAFWIVALWFFVGLLRPSASESHDSSAIDRTGSEWVHAPAPMYAAYRNTLLTVIALFAVYLVFEFQTLWFREFPKGFHYSGYAHEGAAWLTFALGLSTLTLSLIFRGDVLCDERLPRLRRLAWVWSALNLLLAAAVFHRLFIYVGFNGMTRMRIVGFYGSATVVVGFGLAIWKIIRNRDFVWLFRHDLWALSIAIYLYAITPVDAIVCRYNVGRILAGDPAPAVQITVHPIDSEGVMQLTPLLNFDNAKIRDGVRSLLASRAAMLKSQETTRSGMNWWGSATSLQFADEQLSKQLRTNEPNWRSHDEPIKREADWEAFRKYAYQWF